MAIIKKSTTKIRTQFMLVYLFALVVPILVIGVMLLIGENTMLMQYNQDLLSSDNQRVHAIMFEITNQAYTYSEDICYDQGLQNILKTDFVNDSEFKKAAVSSVLSTTYERTAQIDKIKVYTDNPSIISYSFFEHTTEETTESDWYKKAISQSTPFWTILTTSDSFGNIYSYLSLVRKIPLINSDTNAILVISLSDNYLKARISTTEYHTVLSLDEGNVFFCDDRDLYNKPSPYYIDYKDPYFKSVGLYEINDKKYLSSISSFSLYQSSSCIHLCIYSIDAYKNMQRLTFFYLAIMLLAILLPGLIITMYIRHFASRVEILRNRIHKASQEDYTISLAINGHDELADVYSDLDVLIHNIQQKEAQMYQVVLDAKELKNEQQQMEYKMLASQINPHFLYNTLETIRMKAITAGNKEVADAIKLLGKSMRYVLENTNSSSTTLKNELDYVQIYLSIQKLRFGDRINYELVTDNSIDLEHTAILPLILQPIVENAILHGLERVSENGHIIIYVFSDNSGQLTISVKDNGIGLDEDELKSLREKLTIPNQMLQNSIGLYNIHERIRLYYGSSYGIIIDSTKGEGTIVKISIPEITI